MRPATGLPARVRTEARLGGKAIPVARIVAPARSKLGHDVVLDGATSSGAKAFHWTQVGGPWVLLGAEPAEPEVSFKPTASGTYEFELEVDDGQVRSAPVRVSVVVGNDGAEN